MLGLSRNEESIPTRMITTSESLVGYQITEMLGPVEKCAEKGYSAVLIGGVGAISGGGLDTLIQEAKIGVAIAASDRGANAVVAFRYCIAGRELEKSVVAYGTAVRCQKVS